MGSVRFVISNNMKLFIILSILVISVLFVNALPQFSVKPCDPNECKTLFGNSPNINDCNECNQCEQCVDLDKLREILGPDDQDWSNTKKNVNYIAPKGQLFAKVN